MSFPCKGGIYMIDLWRLAFSNSAYRIFSLILIAIAVVIAISCFKSKDYLLGITVICIAIFITLALPIIWFLFSLIGLIVVFGLCLIFAKS